MGKLKYIALLLFAVSIGFIMVEYVKHTTSFVHPDEYAGLETLDNGRTYTPLFSIHNITEGAIDTTADGETDDWFLLANRDTNHELYYSLLDVDANETIDKVSITYDAEAMFYRLINKTEDGKKGYQFLGISNLNAEKRFGVVYHDYNTDGYFDYRHKMDPLNRKNLGGQEIMCKNTWCPVVNKYNDSYSVSEIELPTGENIHVLFDRELRGWREDEG